MADKVKLDRALYDTIVGKAKAGLGRSVIQRETGTSDRIVGKVLAAAGLTNSRSDVVGRDREVVSSWLRAAGEKANQPWARRRPATPKKTAARKSR